LALSSPGNASKHHRRDWSLPAPIFAAVAAFNGDRRRQQDRSEQPRQIVATELASRMDRQSRFDCLFSTENIDSFLPKKTESRLVERLVLKSNVPPCVPKKLYCEIKSMSLMTWTEAIAD
jgi:hypothetical protein